jgi:hypothetical protein
MTTTEPKVTREHFHALCTDVASALGWLFKAEGESYDYTCSLQDKGMGFSLAYDKWKHRISVRSWNWPQYTVNESRGYVKTETVMPSSLYDPREASPSITVSADKTAAQIAKDIQTRFLPEYTRLYARCLARAQSSQEYADTSESGWQAVCKVIGADPKHHHHYSNIAGEYNASIENRSGKAHVTLDLTADQLAKVIAALR